LLGQWLGECCDVEPDNHALMEKTATLFASWSAWARERGENPGTQTILNDALRRRDLNPGVQIKALKTRGCYGIRLKLVPSWHD
jgi:putative DNA primase/helicase